MVKFHKQQKMHPIATYYEITQIQQDIRHIAWASVIWEPQTPVSCAGKCLFTRPVPSPQGQTSSQVLRWRSPAGRVPVLISNQVAHFTAPQLTRDALLWADHKGASLCFTRSETSKEEEVTAGLEKEAESKEDWKSNSFTLSDILLMSMENVGFPL